MNRSGAESIDAWPLWAVGFDPADLLGTPHGLSPDADVPGRLAAAVLRLRAAGFDLDSPLGELQTADRDGERIAVHGGTGSEGVTNVVGFGTNDTTTVPAVAGASGSRHRGSLTTLGYPVSNGTSFIFNVEFTANGPVAEAVAHLRRDRRPDEPVLHRPDADVRGQAWRPTLFTPDAITADPALRKYTISE